MEHSTNDVYRILAVDDDESILIFYRDLLVFGGGGPSALEAVFGGADVPLEDHGPTFTVDLCRDAETAQELVLDSIEHGTPYAIALVDIRLADGPDGIWAAENIRAKDPNVEIVMVTGRSDVTLAELNRRIPPPEKLLFIQKPFRADELRQLANSLCAKWETERKLRELNETLSHKVDMRTAALHEANERLRQDIAKRKDVLEKLQASEERYRKLFDEDITGNFVADPDGNLLACNQTFKRVFGFESPEEMKRFNVFSLELDVGPGQSFRRMLQEEGRVASYEVTYTPKGKRPVDLLGLMETVSNSEGVVTEIRGYFYDITERKRLEEQLRQAQKMEALGTLAGGIAHDFNNILGVIMGYSEIIRDSAGADDGLKRRIGQVLDAGARARDLINQILNFSRQGTQERKSLRIVPLIKEALKMLRSTIPINIDIRSSFDVESDLAVVDATQLHQILLNLCMNASHAMGVTGGVLEVQLEDADDDPRLPPEFGDGKWFLRLSVTDTGHGMEPEIVERIFDPFFTTKRAGEGTGMGLAVVHGIVKKHEGTVVVESEPGKGSAFHVYLPRASGQEMVERERSVLSLPLTGRILFVDDELPLVDIGREMLEGFGFEVVSRTSSVEALEAFRFRPDAFDLVITDQYMPNMTGMELSREILRIRPGMPIILCTGFSDTLSHERAKEEGVGDFVMKPLLKHELITSISGLLSVHAGDGQAKPTADGDG